MGPELQATSALLAGDESAFSMLAERHRRELHVHCYRMLGSFEDAEDLVQETFLRAWRKRSSFRGSSTFRAWLYRIATNACLDALERRPRRVLPHQVVPAADPRVETPPAAEEPWLQPYPDSLLDSDDPESAAIDRETIELAFLVAIQQLPPRQRAVFILRDVVDWSAKETAALLETNVVSVNSALQRARATLRRHLPAGRLDWTSPQPSGDERALLERYVDAHGQADGAVLRALLREDALLAMPPLPTWFDGRDAIATFHTEQVFPAGSWRLVPFGLNRQPAVAIYIRRPDDAAHRALAFDVLRVEDGLVAEITAFVMPQLFPAFGLPSTIDDSSTLAKSY